MFNPWINMQPSQTFPFWGQPPAAPSNISPPVFAQLFDFGSLMQSMQDAMQSQVKDTGQMRQMEDLIRSFSAAPLMAGLPGAVMPQQNPWASFFSASDLTSAWNPQTINTPALGITREYQEDWTELTNLRQDHDTALRSFGDLFQDFTRRAGESFVASVSADDAQDFSVLCRKWIDCCEKEFQTIAQTPEFSERLGEMINTNLRLLQHSNRMQEKAAELQGQPTRGELNEMQRRNVEAQKRIDALEERVRQLESSKTTK